MENPLKLVEDAPTETVPSNGDAPQEEPTTPEGPALLREITISVIADGRFSLKMGQDISGTIGDLRYAIKILEHRQELELLEEKILAQSAIMARLQAEGQNRVVGVRGNPPGTFPGPVKARH